MHLPEAATTASIEYFATSMSIAPKELIASTIKPLPWRAQTAAMSCSGLRIPVPVSQCTCATWVIAGSRAIASSTMAAVGCLSSAMSIATCARPSTLRIFTMRWQ